MTTKEEREAREAREKLKPAVEKALEKIKAEAQAHKLDKAQDVQHKAPKQH